MSKEVKFFKEANFQNTFGLPDGNPTVISVLEKLVLSGSKWQMILAYRLIELLRRYDEEIILNVPHSPEVQRLLDFARSYR